MKFYDKKNTQPQELVSDYLTEMNIQIGMCKYSNEIITRTDNEKVWKKHNKKVINKYHTYNHWNINIQSNKVVQNGSAGEVKTVYRKGVKVQDNTGFSVTKGIWIDLLELVAEDNVIDTSQLLYDEITQQYSSEKIQLEETEKFVDLFASKCVGDTEFNKQKMRVLLNTYVRRSLGGKTDYVAVFKSDEGSGKSEFFNELLSPFIEHKLVNLNAKLSDDEWKFKEYFADNTGMIIEEMGVGEKAHSAFKNFTSMTDFELKPKSSNVVVEKRSRAMMMFALNDAEFIYGNDKRNRRFLVFDFDSNVITTQIGEKFVSIFADINFEKLWAEQYNMYSNNVSCIVDWDDLTEDNKKYLVKSTFKTKDNHIVDIVSSEILDNNGHDAWLSSTDIKAIIKHNYADSVDFNKADNNIVTKLLKKMMIASKNRTSSLTIPPVELEDGKYYNNTRSNRYLVKINDKVLIEFSSKTSKTTNIDLGIDIGSILK